MAAPEYMNDLLKSFGVYSWLQLVDLVCRHNMYMIPSFLIERKNLQNQFANGQMFSCPSNVTTLHIHRLCTLNCKLYITTHLPNEPNLGS